MICKNSISPPNNTQVDRFEFIGPFWIDLAEFTQTVRYISTIPANKSSEETSILRRVFFFDFKFRSFTLFYRCKSWLLPWLKMIMNTKSPDEKSKTQQNPTIATHSVLTWAQTRVPR